PTAPVPRVLVSGQPVATLAAPYAVAGCPFVPVTPLPCVTGQWVVGATRVLAMGQPLALQGGVSICVPNGTPLLPTVVPSRGPAPRAPALTPPTPTASTRAAAPRRRATSATSATSWSRCCSRSRASASCARPSAAA